MAPRDRPHAVLVRRPWTSRLLLPLLASSAAVRPCGAQQPVAPPPVAFVNVTVIPMDRPRTLPGRTVVVDGGVVTALGPVAEVQVPQGARVVDGADRFLIPGLADMHVHLGRLQHLDLLVANGVTLVRNMAGVPWHLMIRRQIEAGELLGPRILTTGLILEGTPPPEFAGVIVTSGRAIVNDSATGARAVANQMGFGYDLAKVYNNLPRAAYAGIVAEARARGVAVAGHVPFPVGLDGVLAAGQGSIEHLRGYIQHVVPADAPDQPGPDFRSRLVAWRHADTSRFQALAERTVRAGTWNTPTLALRLTMLPADRIHQLTERPVHGPCRSSGRVDRRW